MASDIRLVNQLEITLTIWPVAKKRLLDFVSLLEINVSQMTAETKAM